MTEAEWLAGTDPLHLLKEGIRVPSDRKQRLFACACCRRIWDHLVDKRSEAVVELAEEYADGFIDKDAWWEAWEAAREATVALRQSVDQASYHASEAAFGVARQQANQVASHTVVSIWQALGSLYKTTPRGMEERLRQCDLVREIFGNPFRPITLSPSWLTSTVVSLANQMYNSRDFSAIPILADAMQDAGCDNEDLLNHCRGPGPHTRGCFVVDNVLGKQ
jgi:hypothetical protein